MPEGEYDIIFCKNLVGMYFSRGLAIDTFNKVISKMNKGGFLLLGNHEEFPEEATKNIKVYDRGTHIYRKE